MSPSAGISRWRVMEGDTIGKMDQVFGLMPGAAISGPTTDNVFFFAYFGGLHLDPLFALLPTAAIVAGGRHSLLEVGLPLTLNGYGNYKVGLYTTLFPRGSQVHGRPAGVAEIESILRVAENHPDNHLMVVHYAGQEPAGSWLYDSASDRKTWRGMITGEPLLAAFKVLPPWPDEAAVGTLVRTLGL